MNGVELIGQVAAAFLREALADEGEEAQPSTARFILNRLSAEQVAAAARALLADEDLRRRIEIKLPRHALNGHGLPDEVLTDQRATYHRHASCEKPALLLYNVGDDEERSLNAVVPIGVPQLTSNARLWVETVAIDLALDENAHCHWAAALTGLFQLRLRALDEIAQYVIATRNAVAIEGKPLIMALGHALPTLKMPRDSSFFVGLKDNHLHRPSRWRALYATADAKRACYLRKWTPTEVLLSSDDLHRAFGKVRGGIVEQFHPTLESFIVAPSGWNEAAAALSNLEYSSFAPLFDGLARERHNLGELTRKFYADREPRYSLTTGEQGFLKGLMERKVLDAEDDDRTFYAEHRDELGEDRKLRSLWDRFIHKRPLESDDFLVGITSSMESLFGGLPITVGSAPRKLTVRCDLQSKNDFKDLNVEAGLFFAARYRGIRGLFGPEVVWECDRLFDFPQLVTEWRTGPKTKLNNSTARAALQVKFLLQLEAPSGGGRTDSISAQLIWVYRPNAVSAELPNDWERLRGHPLVFCRVSRETTGPKGNYQALDLTKANTFAASGSRRRGAFVGAYKANEDLGSRWLQNLDLAGERGLLDQDARTELRESFERFRESYAQAITDFWEVGINSPTLSTQLERYSGLLELVCRRARGDRNRELILRPLLEIGTVTILGGDTAAIIAPWHPLRLAAMAQRAYQAVRLVRHLLNSADVHFGDTRLFFKDFRESLEHPFYPEITLGWRGDKAELLSLTDSYGDYSLHELPLARLGKTDNTGENPGEGAERVAEVVERYLQLHPHKQTNLSVVLYNCDSARLPQAVVQKLGQMHEEEDVHCQIVLRHREARALRSLYERIIEGADNDLDTFNPSEVTRDFMARLRIGIVAGQAPAPQPKDGRPDDIVFSQDVIARHARLEWYRVDALPVPLGELLPSQWSRRRPAAKDDMKSVVYLCCPVQSYEGWVFLTALATFFKDDWDQDDTRRWLPARQLDFQEPEMHQVFEETHNLGNWVVNYDELLDRRQLLNQDVRVIRYRQSSTQGRNLVVSSRASLALLRQMVLGRIRDLGIGLVAEQEASLAERFIQDAVEISGDIVLRAARRGRSASELMGVVLSRFLIREELGRDRLYGWYFLDDYAAWLGQREEHIADVLALSPDQAPNGTLRLAAVITESKYIQAAGLPESREKSQRQLRDTMRRFEAALFGDPVRLDRKLWLARISDMVLDGIQFAAAANIDLAAWRRAIREGSCEIYLRGYSHIFVSGGGLGENYSEFVDVAAAPNCYQEVFGRDRVQELVCRYLHSQSPTDVRADEDGTGVLKKQIYRRPDDHRGTSPAPPETTGFIHTSAVPLAPPERDGSKDPELEVLIAQPSGGVVGIAETSLDSRPGLGPWSYPALQTLLLARTAPDVQDEEDQFWLKDITSRTKAALQQFQLQAKLSSSVLTPNAGLLKFVGSAQLTVEQVLKRRPEFLTTYGLNLLSVQPEPGIVSIAVERPSRRVVQLPELWSRWQPNCDHGNRSLLIGTREDNGNLLLLSPGDQHAPHTLIAGTTGSGKSVLMQNILLSIAATNTPRQARIVLIDPKQGVDYYAFEELPHLNGGLISEQNQALEAITILVAEMESRYGKLRSTRTSNIVDHNLKVPYSERLPVIWLIHDEFAEWMLMPEYKDAVTASVARLGAKARAAGIYLIFAAQRPDAQVMPPLLRSNLDNRLILQVDSEGTSEISLGSRGAERLLGRGHLLAKLTGSGTCYGQVPYVEATFLNQAVAHIVQAG